jgi:predicted MFS family arabinose efflux permease
MYAVGMGLALMMGGALGGSLAKEHGPRRVLPIVVPLTLVVGLAVGWALNGWIAYSQESVFH